MVVISFNPAGYEFEAGMVVLRKSFKAAMGALADEVAVARQEAVDYKHTVDEGASGSVNAPRG